jgi:hypothetical protein
VDDSKWNFANSNPDAPDIIVMVAITVVTLSIFLILVAADIVQNHPASSVIIIACSGCCSWMTGEIATVHSTSMDVFNIFVQVLFCTRASQTNRRLF